MATGVPVIIQSAAPGTPVLINGIAPNQSLTIKITNTGALIVEDANANVDFLVDTQTPKVTLGRAIVANQAPTDTIAINANLTINGGQDGNGVVNFTWGSAAGTIFVGGNGKIVNGGAGVEIECEGTSSFSVRTGASGNPGVDGTQRFTVSSTTVTLADAENIAVGTTTGTQIGTVGGASGQKLGFFAKTPIVQPLLATGAGHTADDIITTLQNLGLVRQT